MEIINNYYNEFNQLKTRNASISKTFVTTKEEILDEIFRDSDGKDKDISIHLIQLFEQKNKVINNTFILTENVLKKIYTGKEFKKDDNKYLTKLKKVLDKVNITKVEFELLFKMKHTSNNEFYQNEIRTLEQDLKNLDVDFPNDLKDLKVPLKKFELNSLNQHNFNTFFTSSPICSIQFN
ncbi:hypothetical protein GLOIN_2v1764869 [Rhizophagus irregularis DAOM 181602=DAOM 197198]|uniref:Uncharacterized protein n=1 Tax=Rhizophagus irregularis (strain DAOM 181602 / DAOM 197198 / MUCL 43194) TaxID=747089 RepID=U9SVD6_RHIID|nr:hypothetical protein GLOIN_2v1764869 [Rhizophagus irregularis DAOM 181602=DAOM 197198]POG80089.1 hypothetical protein GLOIN_2v1764869 [Rhizophagus irregularis DAOM 181602=DAOM 197198]|eukprot:XP_025186955.1 hypothetical protein GLOIN_2v1764869 [Rhizophagus irregularis DAOM 181602=DAOM 197198]